MKISFVVLTYNRSDALLAVLQSLSRQCTSDHEVLIADDGSGDAAVELLFKNCPSFQCPVRHVWHSDNGFTAARARNLGASFATGDYLVFLDGDCVPNRRFARAHERLAERGCFVNGSRVLLDENLTAVALNGDVDLPVQPWTFWLGARLSGHTNKLLHVLAWPWSLFRVQKEFRWHGIRSCNFGIWRQDFVNVNGFDETFEGWGHEDADLVLRLSHFPIIRKNGFLATEVYHLWHRENARDCESINKQKVIQRMKTNIVLAEKGLREIGHDASVKVTPLY
jgi:glycosyltransferase involved in cell wall biosynthesis